MNVVGEAHESPRAPMQFLVIAHDHTDDEALVRRLVVRERHLAAARRTIESGNMLIGGAILDDEGRMVGSMTVVSFPDRATFDEWLRNVPYMKNNVWERVEVYPYHVAVMRDGRREMVPSLNEQE
ncbi:MAG: YciI family protein [Actinobacteria bacterium]|nr:YciI family protein [Actinomycetota bacterium]